MKWRGSLAAAASDRSGRVYVATGWSDRRAEAQATSCESVSPNTPLPVRAGTRQPSPVSATLRCRVAVMWRHQVIGGLARRGDERIEVDELGDALASIRVTHRRDDYPVVAVSDQHDVVQILVVEQGSHVGASRCPRTARPVSVGAYTLWPALRNLGASLRHDQLPCRPPWTNTTGDVDTQNTVYQ